MNGKLASSYVRMLVTMNGSLWVLLSLKGKTLFYNKRSALEEDLMRTDSIFYSFW